jgi:hypothetical protein
MNSVRINSQKFILSEYKKINLLPECSGNGITAAPLAIAR